jgi:hypothetical protein
MSTTRGRGRAGRPRRAFLPPALTVGGLLAYLLLVVYVATTGDPLARLVVDVSIGVGAAAFGTVLFVRDGTTPRVVATAAVLFGAGFLTLAWLLTGHAGAQVVAESALLAGVLLYLYDRVVVRRRAAAGSDG